MRKFKTLRESESEKREKREREEREIKNTVNSGHYVPTATPKGSARTSLRPILFAYILLLWVRWILASG